MSELDLLGAGAQGMARERVVLDIAARNVAAAQASSPGHAYRRLVPVLGADGEVGARESREPADAFSEMVAMLDAQRAYEANASIFDVGKRIVDRTLEVGR